MEKTHLTPPNELGIQNFEPWRFDENLMKYHEMFKQHQVNFQLPQTPKPLKISCSKFFKDNPIPQSMKENIVDMELINKVSGIRREVVGDVDMIEIERISGIKYQPSSPPSKEVPVRSEINKSCEDMLEKIFEELSERDRDKKSEASDSDNLTIKTFDSMEDEQKEALEEDKPEKVMKESGKKRTAHSISKKSIHSSLSEMQTGSYSRKDATIKTNKTQDESDTEQFDNNNSLASFISKKSTKQMQSGNDETLVASKTEDSGGMKKYPSEDSVASSISEKTTLMKTVGMQAYSYASTSSSVTNSNQSTPSGKQTNSQAGNDATSMTEKTASFDQETQTETPSSCKKSIKTFCKRFFKKSGKSKKTTF